MTDRDRPDENPYAVLPDSLAGPVPGAGAERGGARRWSWLAVLVGTAVDIGGSKLAVLAYTILVGLNVASAPDAGVRLRESMVTFPHLHLLFVTGLSLSVLGGFVNGVIARQRELAHGLAEGVATIALVTVMRLGVPAESRLDVPGWVSPLSYVLLLPTVLLGARLALARRQARERRG